MSDAAQVRAEIEAMPTEALREIAVSGRWGIHPLRLGLDTAERLAAARELIADLDRNHARELWRERGSVSVETIAERRLAARRVETARDLDHLRERWREQRRVNAAIAERRLAALARAWERLGGGREFLFHVHGERRAEEDRRVVRTDLAAPRIAIDPGPGVTGAPYFEHPFSLAEAARFAIVLPVMRCCAELATAAVAAFDALGQPTVGQHRRAVSQREAPRRRIVWRIRSAEGSARARVRMVLLSLDHVLCDLGEIRARSAERLGVPAVGVHHGYWGPFEAAAIGVLAWRRACEIDATVKPPPFAVGNRMLPDPAVVGRRYRELDDPFTPLLAILRLGCRLHAFSDEATTLELQPLG